LPENKRHLKTGNLNWDDQDREAPIRVLSREEVRALMVSLPKTSPWRVVAIQALVGAMVACLSWLATRRAECGWSAFYGAACVVVPSALMARGMTSRLSSMSPSVSAVSFMLWEFGKIGLSVLMLFLAPKLVAPLSWPALLVNLVICINGYWVALWWRGRQTN
jgi:ATP synthase protein I